MTFAKFKEFLAARRAAVAITMAIALVPIVLLVGIAIDMNYLSQARTQTAFASQAAATSAVRTAAATYALEVAHGTASNTAALQAINSANVAGSLWFSANLGNYILASLNGSPTTNTTYDGAITGQPDSAQPPNFQAVVSSSTTYPPLFNPVFGRSQPWVFSSTAAAATTFSYAQILLMLDTSGSMLIGADNPTDILPMEQGVVCPAKNYAAGYGITIPGSTIPGYQPLSAGQYVFVEADGDDAQLPTLSSLSGYVAGSNAGTCKNTGSGWNGNSKAPGEPCALACHFSNTIGPSGYTEDFYGLARYENVTLRLDVLFSATEQVIQDMESSEAVANQLSVGVYQFNTDVFPIVNQTTGSGGALPEATTDLASALTQVEGYDFKKTPTETKIPQLILAAQTGLIPNASTAQQEGDTDFPLALKDLEAGNASPTGSNGKLQPLTPSGLGATPATPQKFIFIVTDGMEDDSGNNGDGNPSLSYNVEGEMTSTKLEAGGTGVCSYLKNTLKYTVYVLYVNYNPISDTSYYGPGGARPPNLYTTTDYPGATQSNTTVQSLSAAQTGYAPIALALQACASSTTDFYEANDSASIQTALNNMLKSALASTIRLTN